MKLISGISLCALCLITSLSATSYATEILSKNPENLDKEFVEIEVSNDYVATISVLRLIDQLTAKVQAKYYSLLNWKSHRRTTRLEIENYDRVAQFGRWVNDTQDNECLNTRAKVLQRDSKKPVVFSESNPCVVSQGAWKDPYTSQFFNSAAEIQIDHLVPLKNAYLSGAYKWKFKARCLYANYLGYDFHLLSVFGTENMKKSDKGPDKYMPPDASYACTYVRNWLYVKMLWGLTMTFPEATAIRRILVDQNCPTANFRISETELQRDRKFTDDHSNLCEAVDKTAL